MSTRTMFFVALLIFAVALAIVVGTRLSAEAMSIVLGVAVGVAVGIPTSVLVAVLTRQVVLDMPTQQNLHPPSNIHQEAQPANGNGRSAAPEQVYEPQLQRAAVQQRPQVQKGSQRQFTVVGGASPPLLEDDDLPGNGARH